MAQHRSFESPAGESPNARNRWVDPEATEITDIIPFNEFGNLDDLEFRAHTAFDRECQVIHAPELDDLHDTDDLIPLRLAVPSKFRPEPRDERRSSHAYRDSRTDVSDGIAATDIIDLSARRTAQHRKETASAVKGRLMIAAMAAGATAAAAHSVMNNADTTSSDTVLAADSRPSRAAPSPVPPTACRSSPSRPAADRRCTPRRSPRPPRSPRSAPSARRGCSGRCS